MLKLWLASMYIFGALSLRKDSNSKMKTDSYNSRDPRKTDQWLLKVMAKCFQNSESWDNQTTQVNLVDHPCGFGKTSSLIETINQ